MGIFIAGLDSFFPGKCHPPQHRCALTPHSFAPFFKVKIWLRARVGGMGGQGQQEEEEEEVGEYREEEDMGVEEYDEIGGQY